MLQRALLMACLCSLLWATGAPAGEFNCAKPPYGTALSSINDHGGHPCLRRPLGLWAAYIVVMLIGLVTIYL